MQNLLLESFENLMKDPAKLPEGFEKGYEEGFAAGISAATSTQATLQQELVQSVADLEFKYEEARGEITKSLKPLFSVITEKLFPQLIADGFADQIAMILQQTISQGVTTGFNLSVNPKQRDAIAAALSEMTTTTALSVDPSLPMNAARLRYEQGASHVDFDQLLAEIRTILSAVDVIEPRSETYG